LTPKEARKIGLNEETLRQIKKRMKEGKKLRFYKKTLNKMFVKSDNNLPKVVEKI